MSFLWHHVGMSKVKVKLSIAPQKNKLTSNLVFPLASLKKAPKKHGAMRTLGRSGRAFRGAAPRTPLCATLGGSTTPASAACAAAPRLGALRANSRRETEKKRRIWLKVAQNSLEPPAPALIGPLFKASVPAMTASQDVVSNC